MYFTNSKLKAINAVEVYHWDYRVHYNQRCDQKVFLNSLIKWLLNMNWTLILLILTG